MQKIAQSIHFIAIIAHLLWRKQAKVHPIHLVVFRITKQSISAVQPVAQTQNAVVDVESV